MPRPPDSARALLATIRAGRRQIDTLVHKHLPVERALAFEIKHTTAYDPEGQVLTLVSGILDREVSIWRRSFAARLAHQEPTPTPTPAPAPAHQFAPRPDSDITLTGADRVRAILDVDDEPTPDLDEEIAWVIEGENKDETRLDTPDELEPDLIDQPSGLRFEDEIDRLVLEELERAREELEYETDPEETPQDEDDRIQHLLAGPDPLDTSPLNVDEDSLATGDELISGLDNIIKDEQPEDELPEDNLVLEDDSLVDDGDSLVDDGDSLVDDGDSLVLEDDSLVDEGDGLVLEDDSFVDEGMSDDTDIQHLLDGADLVSFEDPEEVSGSLVSEDEIEEPVEDEEDIRHLLSGDELVSFDGPDLGDVELPEPEPELELEQELEQEAPEEDIQHLLAGDDLISFEDEVSPTEPALIPGELLDVEPEEEATILVPSPIVPDIPDEEATIMARGPVVFVPQADPNPPPRPQRASPQPEDEEEAAVIEEAPTPSWSRRGEREELDREPVEVPRMAAVQLLGDVGKARTVGHTLELEAAEEQPDDLFAVLDAGDEDDDSSELSVTLEEEYEILAPIPQLTDTAEPLSRTAASTEPLEVISDDQVARALQVAVKAESSGDIQSAIVRYGDVIDLDPVNFDARLGRGRCLMEMADYAAAMSDLQRAEDLSPGSAQAPFEMGNLFYARKDYRRAITFYTQAINSDPELVLARVRRGMSYFYRRDHDKALADLERAQNLQPSMPGLSASINKVTRAMHR